MLKTMVSNKEMCDFFFTVTDENEYRCMAARRTDLIWLLQKFYRHIPLFSIR